MWMEGLSLCAEKHVLVVSHLFRFSIHFTDSDGTVSLTTVPSPSPFATTLLIDCLYSLHK